MALQFKYGIGIGKSRSFLRLPHNRIKSDRLRVFSSSEPGNDLDSTLPKNRKVWPMRLLSDKSLRNEWIGLLITVGLTNTVKFVREVAVSYTKKDTSDSKDTSFLEVHSDSLDKTVLDKASNDLNKDRQEEIQATSENISLIDGSSVKIESNVVENSRDISIQKAMINKSHISMLSAPLSSEEMSQRIERNRRLRNKMSSNTTSYRQVLSLSTDFGYGNSDGGDTRSGGGGGGGGGDDGSNSDDDDNDDDNETNRNLLFQILGMFAIISLVGVSVTTRNREEEPGNETG